MKKVNIAMIGCSQIADAHLQAIARSPDMALNLSEAESMVDSIQNWREPITSGCNILPTMAILDEVLKS